MKLRFPVAHYTNTYLRSLNASLPNYMSPTTKDLYRVASIEPAAFVLWDGCRLRRTPEGQPTVGDLIKPRDLIRLEYPGCQARVYEVVEVSLRTLLDTPITCHDIVMKEPGVKVRGDNYSYCNELVAIDRRILYLFEANDEEVIICGMAPSADDILRELLDGK